MVGRFALRGSDCDAAEQGRSDSRLVGLCGQSLFPGVLALHSTQEHPPLSAVPQGNSPTHLDTIPPSHSIPIGPASAATTDGFLQVAVSKARPSALPSHHSSVDARFRYSTRTLSGVGGRLPFLWDPSSCGLP